MKIHFILGLISFFYLNAIRAQEAPYTADAILKQAFQQASSEKKNVFVIFHASWCGWCRRMDSLMNEPDCKNFFSDNYIIKHLVVYESPDKKNLENQGAMDLLIKYHGDKQGIPFWLVFDKNGNLLADSQTRPEGSGLDEPGKNTGCPATPEEINHFIDVLKKTSILNGEQLAVIGQEFSKK